MVKKNNAGDTNCLGWCGKKFWSPDKTRIKFCAKCRQKRNDISESLSRIEMRLMQSSFTREHQALLVNNED